MKRKLIEKINLLNTPFNEQLPVAQLHWIISDSEESITVEAVKDKHVLITRFPMFHKKTNKIGLRNEQWRWLEITNVKLS